MIRRQGNSGLSSSHSCHSASIRPSRSRIPGFSGYLCPFYVTPPVGDRPMLEDLARAWTASGLRPVIDSVFPFARAREAFDHLMTGSHVGKIVIALSD
nr:zinc-binding dehydrogenase [Komagataeibacter europaeus]